MYDGTKEVQLEMFNKEQISCYKKCCERENKLREGITISLEQAENKSEDIITIFDFICLCNNRIRIENEDGHLTASFFDGDIIECSNCNRDYNIASAGVFDLLITLV